MMTVYIDRLVNFQHSMTQCNANVPRDMLGDAFL